MKIYTLFMAVAFVMVALYIATTEGPIHDAAWEEDCKTLNSGGWVQSSGADHYGFLEHC